MVKNVHGMDKLLRLRGIPDTAAAWQWLQQLGVDIINTDKVGECREFFQHRENNKRIHTEGHRGLLRNDGNTDHCCGDKTDSQNILCVITLALFF